MKWMKWITGWFDSATKSIGSLGVGLRAALGGSSPGGWASDHREETFHNTGFNYIAIHAIATEIAGGSSRFLHEMEIDLRSRRSRD